MELSGKKLLILGGKPVGTKDIITYAKSKGVYTIVADYLPVSDSLGKQLADESWDISVDNLDELEKLCIKNNVDGVFSGVHEFTLQMAMKLCERLGKPFYANVNQWEIGTDKALFKQICKEYSLPTAFSYDYNKKNEIKFPVIVKPVDGSSGRGISICKNMEELDIAYKVAMEVSEKKEVIVEKYLYGDEVVVFYTIIDGVSKLSVMPDYFYNYEQETTMPLPQVYIYPSMYLNEYMEKEDAKVRKMLDGLNIKNGTFFLQAFKNEEGFFFFEPGYRAGGSSVCRYTKYLHGISYMEMFVNYALTGSMMDDINKENPYFEKRCCTLSLVVKGGEIGNIMGYEEIKEEDYIIDSELRFNVGDYVKEKSALGQIVMRFFIVADDMEQIKTIIDHIQNTIKVYDIKCNNMLISPFDVSRLNVYE